MNVRDWKLFLKGQWPNEIGIAQVSQEMADYLGAATRNVHLHQAYALKAVEKHQLTAEHLPLIFEVVDYGMALAETKRPLSLTFLHFDETSADRGEWFQVSIKRGYEDRRLFLTTFHRTCADEVARKRRKHTLIREAKR